MIDYNRVSILDGGERAEKSQRLHSLQVLEAINVLCIPWYFQEQDATTLKQVQVPQYQGILNMYHTTTMLFFEIPCNTM